MKPTIQHSDALPISVRRADFGLELAQVAQRQSKDPSTKVGACILSKDLRRTYVGYNGFPKGIADDRRLHDREQKYPRVLHAELNAVLNAGRDCQGAYLFCTMLPCAGGHGNGCAAIVIQAGISAVFIPQAAEDNARWIESQKIALNMFEEAKVKVFLRQNHTTSWILLEANRSKSLETASSVSSTSWGKTLRSFRPLASLTASVRTRLEKIGI